MKKLLMSVGVMLCLNANAQWVNKNVDNDFDELVAYINLTTNDKYSLDNLEFF